MDTVPREDGTLIVGVYRDNVFSTERAQARQEVAQIADSHGGFMLIQKLDAGWRVAVTDSSGYLLPECLAAELSLENLFYVEQIEDDRYILVVVSGGRVLEDSIVHGDDVRSTAAAHFIEHRMNVRVSGLVPIRRFKTDSEEYSDVFTPSPDFIQSWEKLPDRYSRIVPLARSAQLQEWRKARNSALGVNLMAPAVTVVLVVAIITSYQMFGLKEPPKAGPPPDPLAVPAMKWSSGSSLSVLFRDMSSISIQALSVTGWTPSKLVREVGGYVLSLTPLNRMASSQLVETVYPGRAQPESNARSYKISISHTPEARTRRIFESALTSSHQNDGAVLVDSIVRAAPVNAIYIGAEAGSVYRGHQYKITGEAITPVVLHALANVFHDKYQTVAVQYAEYSPLDGKLTVDLILYTR